MHQEVQERHSLWGMFGEARDERPGYLLPE